MKSSGPGLLFLAAFVAIAMSPIVHLPLHSARALAAAVASVSPPAQPEKPKQKEKQKKKRKKRAKKEQFAYEYVVQKGDSLHIIAGKFGVSLKQLKRWNKRATKDPKHLKVGAKLKIYAAVPVRQKRKTYYVVKKGDSLRRIARRLKLDVANLKALNGIRGSLIKPGQKLAYLVPGPEKKSESVGRPSSGKLVNGEKMPAGPGYTYGSRHKIYGTNETITLLIEGFGKFVKKYPKGPTIVLGNLSKKKGGPASPHKSHQSGRDVDIGYVHKKKFQPVTSMLSTSKKNLDPRKTWFLMYAFLETGRVKYMFIDYDIQKVLYEHLKERKFTKRYLKKTFQYPRGKGAEAVIKHVKGHHHHLHLRFLCPPDDKRCVD